MPLRSTTVEDDSPEARLYGQPFNKQQDLRKLQHYLAQLRNEVDQAAYLQLGDLLWRIHYLPNRFDELKDLRIWYDQDRNIEGVVFFLVCQDNPEFFLRPRLFESRMATEMVNWAKSRARQTKARKILTSCISGDGMKERFLLKKGFIAVDDTLVFMGRKLKERLPVSQLPRDYSMIYHDHESCIPSVTGTVLTTDQYAHICHAPGYKRDLGLRVLYKNAEIASGCICWHDDLDRSALLEPVGTAEQHRRKGLAFATIMKTLSNLRKYGVENVFVRTGKKNMSAIHLYRKCGFEILKEDNGWRLDLF